MSTPYQLLGQVRDITGRLVNLGPYETVYGLAITEDSVILGLDRAKVKHTFTGDSITERGRTIYTWRKSQWQTWELADTQTVWWSTDELIITRERPRHDSNWEEMCHRPGTSRTPLDNAGRQSQGYDHTSPRSGL